MSKQTKFNELLAEVGMFNTEEYRYKVYKSNKKYRFLIRLAYGIITLIGTAVGIPGINLLLPW